MKRLSILIAIGLVLAAAGFGIFRAFFDQQVEDRVEAALTEGPPPQPCPPSPAETGSEPSADTTPAPITHVVLIVMENKECGDIIGSPDAPYLNSLADRFALATSWHGITHPSLPNYIALLGGSTFGIDSNCTDCHVNEANLVDQLEAAGISWKAYMEGMPSPCFKEKSAGEYRKRHNPFVYYDDVAGDPSRCAKIVPLTELSADLESGALPSFAWITPGLCHDMHDCSVREGDDFLARLVPPILDALGPDGLLVITWDEGRSNDACCDGAAGGNIATIFAGGAALSGGRSSLPYSHYSLLRTLEDVWGLPPLGAAAGARPVADLLAPRGA